LNRIIVGETELGPSEMDECIRIAGRMDVILSRALAPVSVPARMGVTELYGMQLLELRPIAFSRRQERIKRGFDVLVALVSLVLVSPFLGLVAILIKLTSPGPVLYKSDRVGKGGRHFTFLKFRSMRKRANERGGLEKLNGKTGHIFKIRNDPRVTAVGRFLRRYSLDELPQLVNVLRGEMSVVGPRPLPACDLEPDGQSRAFSNWSEQRSKVLPGITGLWQVRGRSETSFEEMTQLDIEYIRDWSLTLDLKILLETPVAVLTGKGAY
jgi:exopolysaccharide biosynthesis polyprenyl glycosylphosphotransferase